MASTYQKQFCIEIFTPEARIAGLDAVSVSLPARDGQLGILAGHSPLVAMMGAGVMFIVGPGGEETKYFVSGGFAHIREDAVTVLAEECLPTDWIDAEEAWQALQAAKSMPAETDEQWDARDEAVRRARTKFNLAQEKRRRQIEQQRRSQE
jgi:F-type H+-transporting ATPase subunit epsilon